jgi:hypothetical protein
LAAPQLVQDVANVLLDGVRHDHQLVGDLLVGLSRAQQSQHLQLAVPTMCGHLLRWRAPAPIQSLSPLPCRSSSTGRCGDRGTCELASWKALKLSGNPYKIGYLPVTVRFSGLRTSRL